MKNFVLFFLLLSVPIFMSGAYKSVLSNYPSNKYLIFDNLGPEKSQKVVSVCLLSNSEECRISGSLTISGKDATVTITADATASTCVEAARIVSSILSSAAESIKPDNSD